MPIHEAESVTKWLDDFCFHVCVYGSRLTLTACDPCDNRILQELPNPTGQTKAVIFQRSCGPFGGTSTQISVLPTSTQRLIAGGNAFSADTADGSAPALPSGGPPVVVTWTNPQELSSPTILASAYFKQKNKSTTSQFPTKDDRLKQRCLLEIRPHLPSNREKPTT